MEYKFLEELTYKELKELESVLLEENKRKQEDRKWISSPRNSIPS